MLEDFEDEHASLIWYIVPRNVFSLLPNALLSPPEFSAPPLPDLSSWSHGSLSPKGFSSIEVWSLKYLGFESVDLRSDLDFKIWVLYWSLTFERFGVWKCWFEIWFGFKDLGLKIWVLFGFGNNKVLMFEVGVWLYL